MAPKWDLIVVGAGPGGTAAAKAAAEKKLKVLILERAKTPGDKQMSGSYLFRTITMRSSRASTMPSSTRGRFV
jgi:flavin-dependent dehydrogenase